MGNEFSLRCSCAFFTNDKASSYDAKNAIKLRIFAGADINARFERILAIGQDYVLIV